MRKKPYARTDGAPLTCNPRSAHQRPSAPAASRPPFPEENQPHGRRGGSPTQPRRSGHPRDPPHPLKTWKGNTRLQPNTFLTQPDGPRARSALRKQPSASRIPRPSGKGAQRWGGRPPPHTHTQTHLGQTDRAARGAEGSR